MASFFAGTEIDQASAQYIEDVLSQIADVLAQAETASTNANTAATNAEVTLTQVQALLATIPGSATSPWKLSVRLRAPVNVNVAQGPSKVDEVTPAIGDRVLLTSQNNSVENGIWVYQGVDIPMTRADDMDGAQEAPTGTTVYVSQGAFNARSFFTLVSEGDLTPGTDALEFRNVFEESSGAALLPRPYDIGFYAAGGIQISETVFKLGASAREFVFPANFNGSTATLDTAPSGLLVLSVRADPEW